MIGGDLQASAEVTQRYRGVYFAALPDHDNASGVGDFERAYHGSLTDNYQFYLTMK